MILSIQWLQIAIVANIVLSIESVEISYDIANRKIFIECHSSEFEHRGHSQVIDDSDFKNYWSNALAVDFSWDCVVPYIPQTFFKKLVLIEEVYLLYANVQSIKSQDVRQNNNLKSLRLFYNNITELPENLFSFTPQIEFINFAYNKINRIDPNTFAEGVDNLKIIYLHGNDIRTLPENLLAKVKMLERLWLQNNKIVRFNCNILPPSLANKIIYIQDYDLKENNKTAVYIRDNPLKELNLNCF